MIFQFLWELLEIRFPQGNDLPAAGFLQDGSIPVVGTHRPQQDPVLWESRSSLRVFLAK